MSNPTLDDVRSALALGKFDHERAWQLMAPRQRGFRRPADRPGQPRQAGVLLLLYPSARGLTFVLTRRTEQVGSHKGQVSLPGGAVEPVDRGPVDAALREACEELAVCQDDIAVLGQLTPLYVIVSDYEIHPVVGTVPARPRFVPQPSEVAEVIETPLSSLLDDRVKAEETWLLDGMELEVPFYHIDGHAVWGATATILSEFERRLRAVVHPGPA